MKSKTERRFPLGRVVATPNALGTIPPDEVTKALDRHAACDWGYVSPANELSLREGFRLLSVYHTTSGVEFWLLTEADRSATTVLLPGPFLVFSPRAEC
jgi:hypothetical protein